MSAIFSQYPAIWILLIASAVATGCTTTPPPLNPPTSGAIQTTPSGEQDRQELIPVVRYGRYTLVELAPSASQRDLLLQVVDVAMPKEARATVGDGLRHVLQRSGYRLCETVQTAGLYALPLPAAHLHLGPLTLRDALLTLAGPAWDLEVDDRTRQVCFVRPRPDTDSNGIDAIPGTDSPALEAVQTFTIAAVGQP